MVAALVEREHVVTRFCFYIAVSFDAAAQYALEVRLEEKVRMMPAIRPNPTARDQYEQLAFSIHVANVAANPKLRQQCFGKPHGLEQPHALTVERNRTRHVIN